MGRGDGEAQADTLPPCFLVTVSINFIEKFSNLL